MTNPKQSAVEAAKAEAFKKIEARSGMDDRRYAFNEGFDAGVRRANGAGREFRISDEAGEVCPKCLHKIHGAAVEAAKEKALNTTAQIFQALSMMRSMIQSGERFTDDSWKAYHDARKNLEVLSLAAVLTAPVTDEATREAVEVGRQYVEDHKNGVSDASVLLKLPDAVRSLITNTVSDIPLCPVHKHLDETGELVLNVGNDCLACSLNERTELLDLLAPHVPEGGADSVAILRATFAHYDRVAEAIRYVVANFNDLNATECKTGCGKCIRCRLTTALIRTEATLIDAVQSDEWAEIKSESDLPKELNKYLWKLRGEIDLYQLQNFGLEMFEEDGRKAWAKLYSHWKRITPPTKEPKP